jgi:predicted porin
MNKTLLYVTAAAGLIASGAALADAANVEIYGTLNSDFENVKATGGRGPAVGVSAAPAGQMNTGAATGVVQPSRNRVTSNSSNIGFRGKEDLGMGLNAIFQIESGLNMDAGSTSPNTTNTNGSGVWASRNSNIGLSSSKLGTLFYGNWDTPYKTLTNTGTFDSFWATGIANGNTMIGTPGFNVASSTASGRAGVLSATAPTSVAADASFDRRQGNSVQYWTPSWSGISAKFAYSANEQRSSEPASASGTTTNPNINPTIYSVSLRYEYGPFAAAYAFEQHRDYFGLSVLGGALPTSVTNNTSRDNANKATLSYKLDTSAGTTYLNVAFERLSYNNSDNGAAAVIAGTGNLLHYDRDLVYFAGKHQIGANTFRLGFGNAWSGSCDRNTAAATTACSTTGLDARQYSLGYSYSLSKRTDLYGLYTKVNNGQFATYQLGNAAGVGAAAGSDSQGFGLGMRHVF